MSYHQFNTKEILQKAKERYSKEKAAEYYLQNKGAIKEMSLIQKQLLLFLPYHGKKGDHILKLFKE